MEILAIVLVVLTVAGLVVLLQLINNRWLVPKEISKKLNSDPFTKLLANGYLRKGDVLQGIRKNYTVLIGYDASNTAINIRVLFDAGPYENYYKLEYLQSLLADTDLNNFWTGKQALWTASSISYDLSYYNGLKIQSYERLESTINQLIAILEKGSLQPISLNKYKLTCFKDQ